MAALICKGRGESESEERWLPRRYWERKFNCYNWISAEIELAINKKKRLYFVKIIRNKEDTWASLFEIFREGLWKTNNPFFDNIDRSETIVFEDVRTKSLFVGKLTEELVQVTTPVTAVIPTTATVT